MGKNARKHVTHGGIIGIAFLPIRADSISRAFDIIECVYNTDAKLF